MTVTEDLIQSFIQSLRWDERSDATVEKYERDVRRFAAFAAGREADRQLVLDYKASLMAAYKVRSVNSMLAALNTFLRFCGRPELCVRALRLQKAAYCDAERELSREEYSRLVQTAADRGDMRLSLILQTLCSTGLRVSELSAVTVEAVREGRVEITCKGKSRVVFLPSRLQNKLLRYCKRCHLFYGPVFRGSSGKTMSRSCIWQAMKRLCAQAGVAPKKVFPHNLRHLFARTYYALEHDLSKLADLLGHSSVNTTRLYIISTGAEHRRQMEQMHLVL